MQPSSPGAGSTDVKKVMISSTALDLSEHRNQVRDACLRQGMFPLMMEYLSLPWKSRNLPCCPLMNRNMSQCPRSRLSCQLKRRLRTRVCE
jgi:uncharacterized protein DUF4062